MADKRFKDFITALGLATLAGGEDVPVIQGGQEKRARVSEPGGLPRLDSAGKLVERLSYEGAPGGVALLDAAGMVLDASGAKIIERGSNANGEYVRFADGTQICWNTSPITGLTPTTSTTQGLTIYRAYITWTFPAAFVAIPATSVNPRLYAGGSPLVSHLGTAYSGSTGLTSALAIFESLLDFDEVREPALIAIGRWK